MRGNRRRGIMSFQGKVSDFLKLAETIRNVGVDVLFIAKDGKVESQVTRV